MPRYKSSNFEGGFDKVYRVITREIGLEASAFLGHLINIRDYHKGNDTLFKDEFFFYTSKDIEKYLGLKRKPQQRLITKLVQLNFLKLDKWGAPLRIYFAVNDKAISQFIEKASVQKEHCAMSERNTTYCPKGTLHSVQKEQTLSRTESSIADKGRTKTKERLSSSLIEILNPAKEYLSECVSLNEVMELVNKRFKTTNYELNSYWTISQYRNKLIELKAKYGNNYSFDLGRAEVAAFQYYDYINNAYTKDSKAALLGHTFIGRFLDYLENYADPKFELYKGQFGSSNTILISDALKERDMSPEGILKRNIALKSL